MVIYQKVNIFLSFKKPIKQKISRRKHNKKLFRIFIKMELYISILNWKKI